MKDEEPLKKFIQPPHKGKAANIRRIMAARYLTQMFQFLDIQEECGLQQRSFLGNVGKILYPTMPFISACEFFIKALHDHDIKPAILLFGFAKYQAGIALTDVTKLLPYGQEEEASSGNIYIEMYHYSGHTPYQKQMQDLVSLLGKKDLFENALLQIAAVHPQICGS